MNDIRKDPEVVRVYWEMVGISEYRCTPRHYNRNGHPDHPDMICKKCSTVYRGFFECLALQPTKCQYPDPIPLSIGDLAFWMKSKCERYVWMNELFLLYQKKRGTIEVGLSECLYDMEPEQWIRAACVAWKGMK